MLREGVDGYLYPVERLTNRAEPIVRCDDDLGDLCAREQPSLAIGPPRGGKGVTAHVTKQLVGPDNYAVRLLGSLGGRFGLQGLIGRSVAVITDARIGKRDGGKELAEKILSISGEDAPAVERKNLPDWTGCLSTRFWIITNELPQIEDASGALNSRFLLLPYPISHLGEEDLDLESGFVAELPSILNWSLAGFDRLHQRGRFVQPSSALALMENFEELGSPIRAFVRADYVLGPGKVEHDGMWQTWQSWAEATGNNPWDPGDVWPRLASRLPADWTAAGRL